MPQNILKHCHISILSNEITFLKYKVPFLYENFNQLIFVDYDLKNKCNSSDGSLEYIKSYPDPDNKIILIKDINNIATYCGEGFVEKQKMFGAASKVINDDTDIVWATDLDEFFHKSLIEEVEKIFISDESITAINIPHKVFVYDHNNYWDINIVPRIIRHSQNRIYGHCNFHKYGKTIYYSGQFIYHFGYVGYNRCYNKLLIYSYNKMPNHYKKWLEEYMSARMPIEHPNPSLRITSKTYNGEFPEYLNAKNLCDELNV